MRQNTDIRNRGWFWPKLAGRFAAAGLFCRSRSFLEIRFCVVARWKIRSLHGRHIVELTTPMGQYVRYMTLQAVDIALGRSYAILKSQLTTDHSPQLTLEICTGRAALRGAGQRRTAMFGQK